MEDLNQIQETVFPIAEIIAQKLSNAENLSEEDEKQLNNWLSYSERNRLLYDRIKDGQNQEEWNKLIRQIDTEQAWSRFSMYTGIKDTRKRSVQWWHYAAGLLIPVLVVSLFYVTRHNTSVTDSDNILKEQIVPGSRNAILVLGNGKNIKLEKNDSLNIEEEDGTRIIKNAATLSYHKINKKAEAQIPQNTLIVPRGGEYNMVLSDSTKVYLNSMSQLRFPIRFPSGSREVFLEGEACFIVKKDPAHPFIVNVNGIKIEVLGTTFDVNAYPDQGKIITTLVKGKIKLSLPDSPGKEFCLAPNDQAVLNRSTQQVQVDKVDAGNYIQWINGIYVFNNESLEEIMKTLSRWYDFNYWFEQEDIKNIKFNGGLNKYESIEPILEIIESTGKVEATINKNNILFRAKKK